MSDMANAIMDAAERHIRAGGFGGFSFRDLASEVGVKSSSVHYHFPTKEKLAAAVVRRYKAYVSTHIDQLHESEPDPIKVWTTAFRGTVHSEKRMCPCTVLGAATQDLPPEVSAEVRGFYRMCLDKLTTRGLSEPKAAEFLSTIVGAQVLANALDDAKAFDEAAGEVLKTRGAAA